MPSRPWPVLPRLAPLPAGRPGRRSWRRRVAVGLPALSLVPGPSRPAPRAVRPGFGRLGGRCASLCALQEWGEKGAQPGTGRNRNVETPDQDERHGGAAELMARPGEDGTSRRNAGPGAMGGAARSGAVSRLMEWKLRRDAPGDPTHQRIGNAIGSEDRLKLQRRRLIHPDRDLVLGLISDAYGPPLLVRIK